MLTVACVQTRDYAGRGPEYVRRLQAAVARHLVDPHRFVCVTDRPIPGVECLRHDPIWPGWWAKLQLFAPGKLEGDRFLYFDLDTFILGDLRPLAGLEADFALLRDVWSAGLGQSAVMAWRPAYAARLWHETRRLDPIRLNPTARMDHWLAPLTPDRVYLQDALPGYFRSFKAEARDGPGSAAVVFFHGIPRPHAAEGWAATEWARQAV